MQITMEKRCKYCGETVVIPDGGGAADWVGSDSGNYYCEHGVNSGARHEIAFNFCATLRCPGCKKAHEFSLEATGTFVLNDAGFEVNREPSLRWEPTSRIECGSCGMVGTVDAFTVQQPDLSNPSTIEQFLAS